MPRSGLFVTSHDAFPSIIPLRAWKEANAFLVRIEHIIPIFSHANIYIYIYTHTPSITYRSIDRSDRSSIYCCSNSKVEPNRSFPLEIYGLQQQHVHGSAPPALSRRR